MERYSNRADKITENCNTPTVHWLPNFFFSFCMQIRVDLVAKNGNWESNLRGRISFVQRCVQE